jgi:Xaa-Pro dipeptidase
MAVATRPANEPVSSGELQILDLERASEVERRHQVLAAYLDLQGDDALVIQRPSNFAWLTGGGDNLRPGSPDPTTSLFITREARVALCNSVDSLQVFDRELSGLGFQLKERPWDEPRQVLVQDLCRGRRVATDVPAPGMRDAENELADFRRSLSEREIVTLRRLARMLTHAVEATARNFAIGDTEAEVAGQLAHRLLRHQMTPVRLQVLADGQGRRYRNWSHGSDRIERFCTIGAVARMHGLHCGVTRTVSLGQPPNALLEAHQTASLVAATAFFFSQAGWDSQQTWQRIERIYEKYGAAEEWRSAEQGDVTGYEAVEIPFTPRTKIRLSTGTPIFWRPSVRIAAIGETILIHADRTEVLTKPEDWPQLSVNVKGMSVQVPDILIREVSHKRIRRP